MTRSPTNIPARTDDVETHDTITLCPSIVEPISSASKKETIKNCHSNDCDFRGEQMAEGSGCENSPAESECVVENLASLNLFT